MAIASELGDDGVRVVTMDYPPVNALPVQGWFDLAEALDAAGRDLDTHVVVLRAEGKGFNAGVDIKEMQASEGFDALIGANRGCFAAFRAVYECAVPVIAAVQGFCLGGGVGLVGNADCIVASDDAFFGIPEVDRGALGAATHLSRMVPPHLMRTLYFTGRNIAATDLVQHGSVLEVVPRERLDEAALAVAAEIARKDTRVIRMAKEAINGIDPVDVNRSYRFEQGFTMELNLAGVADEHRDAFAGTDKGSRSEHAQQGDVRRGRRRPDQGRDDRRHRRLGLAAQADGAGAGDPAQRPEGPHDRVVRRPGRGPASPVRQGVPRRLRVRDPGLDPARAAVLACSPGGHCVVPRVGRGDVPDRPACCRATGPVPADARRARLRRTRERPVAAHRHQPVRRRGGAGRRTRSRARRGAGAHEPRRPVRQCAVPRSGPLLRRPVLHGREGGLRLDRADHRHRRA